MGSRRKPDAGAERHDAYRKRLDRAAELYLHACYDARRPATAEEFAEYLRVARPYLSRRVPELIGAPVSEFLRKQQLQRAKDLLRALPVLSVEQVAAACGFGNVWTFQRHFKALFGVSPSTYRKQVTK